MRSCDLETSAPVWTYKPEGHKTEHRGKTRTVYLGPLAQEVLLPWLEAARSKGPRAYLFPCHHPRRGDGRPDCYTENGMWKAIRRAAKKAGDRVLAPNQLRHRRAEELRELEGIEAVKVSLGHSTPTTSEIYAAERGPGGGWPWSTVNARSSLALACVSPFDTSGTDLRSAFLYGRGGLVAPLPLHDLAGGQGG